MKQQQNYDKLYRRMISVEFNEVSLQIGTFLTNRDFSYKSGLFLQIGTFLTNRDFSYKSGLFLKIGTFLTNRYFLFLRIVLPPS